MVRKRTLPLPSGEALIEVRVLRDGSELLSAADADKVVDTLAELAADVCDAVVEHIA